MEIESYQLGNRIVRDYQDRDLRGEPRLGLLEILLVDQDRFDLQATGQELLDQGPTLGDEPTAKTGQIGRPKTSIRFESRILQRDDRLDSHLDFRITIFSEPTLQSRSPYTYALST